MAVALEGRGGQPDALRRRPRVFFSIPYATTLKGSVRRHDGADRVAEVSVDLPTLPPDGETRLVVPAAGQHSCRRSGSRRRKHRAHPATRNQTDQPDGTNTSPPDPNTNPLDPNTNPSGVVGAADPDGVEHGEDPSDPCAQQGRHYAAAGPPHTPAHPHLPTHTCTLATPHSSPHAARQGQEVITKTQNLKMCCSR